MRRWMQVAFAIAFPPGRDRRRREPRGRGVVARPVGRGRERLDDRPSRLALAVAAAAGGEAWCDGACRPGAQAGRAPALAGEARDGRARDPHRRNGPLPAAPRRSGHGRAHTRNRRAYRQPAGPDLRFLRGADLADGRADEGAAVHDLVPAHRHGPPDHGSFADAGRNRRLDAADSRPRAAPAGRHGDPGRRTARSSAR